MSKTQRKQDMVLKELTSAQKLVEIESELRGRGWEDMALEKDAEAGPDKEWGFQLMISGPL